MVRMGSSLFSDFSGVFLDGSEAVFFGSGLVPCFFSGFFDAFLAFSFLVASSARRPRSLRPRRPVFSSAVFGEIFCFLKLSLAVAGRFWGFGAWLTVKKAGDSSWRPESESSFLYFSDCSMVSRISSSTSFLGRE